MIMTGAPAIGTGSGRANNPSVMRSGDLNSELALGVCGAECPQALPGLIETIGVLDGHSEGAGLQQPTQALQVIRGWRRHDVVAPRFFAGRSERRGATAVVLEDGRVGDMPAVPTCSSTEVTPPGRRNGSRNSPTGVTETVLFGPFRPPYTAQITVGALLIHSPLAKRAPNLSSCLLCFRS